MTTDPTPALERASALAGEAMGQLRLALSARRGLSRTRLRQWAEALRAAATLLEELAG